MHHIVYFFSSLVSLILAFTGMIAPNASNTSNLPYAPLRGNEILLNVALVSDTHIDSRLPGGKAYLTQAFEDIESSEVKNDAVVVCGDLTNYGEEQGIIDFFSIMTSVSTVENKIIAMGNHDIGHTSDLGMTNQEARDQFLRIHNAYLNTSHEKNYYSYDVNGYKFIVLCDESEDNWDEFEIYEEQTAFLDAELAEAAETGLPAFVVCHEPTVGQNGQETVHDGGSMQPESSDRIKAVMEKYKNVFYISGHMHEGINGDYTEENLGFRNIETVNGVTYVSLPSYLLFNRYGYMGNGMGMQMEVYENEVVFRARNFSVSDWYEPDDYTYTVALV